MKELFIEFIVQPFYNFLFLLMNYITPDLGLSIIIIIVLFRFIIYPLSKKQIQTQIQMKKIQEPLAELKKKFKDTPEELGRAIMKLYKDHNVNPFSGILILLIQMPLLFGFYYVFARAGLPEINTDLIYSFVAHPININTNFLGIFELTSKSAVLAAIAALTQYFQFRLLMSQGKPEKKKEEKKDGVMGDVMKGMQTQMTYVMPLFIMFIAYTFGAIIALYFIVSNIFSIGQEIYIRKKDIRKGVQS